MKYEKIRSTPKGILRRVGAFARNRRGNISVMFGLLLIPIVGAVAIGTEFAGWLVEHRAEQNAADSAAIAAAAEGGDAGDYTTVGTDVANQYGFTAGTTNNITTAISVTEITSNKTISACTASTPCYEALITRTLPVTLASVVGYTGDSGTKGYQRLEAAAVAVTQTVQGPFCIVALGSSGIRINGGGSSPSTLTCNAFSAGGMTCNGSHAQITLGVADSEGDIKGTCGDENQFEDQGVPANVDPFAGDEGSIAGAISGAISTCGTAGKYYPVGNSNLPPCNTISSGNPAWDGGSQVYYGDVVISGNITLTSTSPSTLIIENGNLDITGSLTSGSGGLTVIFTCGGGTCASSSPNNSYTSGGNPVNFLTGGGNIDIGAPSSGNFSGVVIFQDTNLPITSPSFGGSSPSLFEVSGGIQAAQSNLTFSGDVGRASAGLSCFTLIVNSLLINGNAFVLDFPEGAQAQCPQSQQVDALTGYTGHLVE